MRAGAAVEKGAELVSIDRFDYEGALLEAQANLAEAKARIVENEAQIALETGKLKSAQEQLDFARNDVARAEKLRKRNNMTAQQMESRRLILSQREQSLALIRDTITVQQSRVAQLEASVDRLEWRVKQAEKNLNSTVLKAPFDGIVRSSSAEVGRIVTANDVVVSLYEAGSLEVAFTLSDAQYGRLQTSDEGLIGRSVELVWTVGGKAYRFDATIERIGAEITSNRGGVEVIARIAETAEGIKLRPGAFVEVLVPDKVFAGTYRVPETAIYGTDIVYTVVDGKLVENRVDIVAFDGSDVLVASGLTPGDEVMTTRITEVSAGLNVRRESDANAPPSSTAGEEGAGGDSSAEQGE